MDKKEVIIKQNKEEYCPRKIKMNFQQKIYWRIKFLLLEAWGKDLDIIKLALSPSRKRGTMAEIAALLSKKNIIIWDKINQYFKFKDYIFYYKDKKNLPLDDLISIWEDNENYFKKNFSRNSSYDLDGPYEKDGVVISNGDYLIDAGAHIGLFSIFASKKVGNQGKIYSFEPIKETRGILEKNIKANNINNVLIFKEALGKSNVDLNFIMPSSLSESSGFFTGNYPKETVRQITLDELFKEQKIKKLDFIKADIEGMERDLLKGAEFVIKKFKPKLSICVYHRIDDLQIIRSMIQNFVPEYNIKITKSKLFAWI